MNWIQIKKLNPSNSDNRGSVYEWCKGEKGVQVTVYKRKAGTVFANHYHKGRDPSKNPERFLLVSGKAKLVGYNGLLKETIDVIIDEDTEVIIMPNVLHTFEALTDVIFLEYRSTVFDPKNSDCYSAETYLIESKNK